MIRPSSIHTHTIVVQRVWLDCAWVSPWSIDWAQDNHKCLHKIEVEVVLFPEEMAETIHCFDGSIKTLLEIEDWLDFFYLQKKKDWSQSFYASIFACEWHYQFYHSCNQKVGNTEVNNAFRDSLQLLLHNIFPLYSH